MNDVTSKPVAQIYQSSSVQELVGDLNTAYLQAKIAASLYGVLNEATKALIAAEAVSKTSAELSVEGGRIWLASSYNAASIDAIKTIPNRSFDPLTKRWNFPPEEFKAVHAVAMKFFPDTKIPLLRLATQAAAAIHAKAGAKEVTFKKMAGWWYIYSPYSKTFVDEFKATVPSNKRAWASADKAWRFSEDYLEQVVELAQKVWGQDKVEVPT